MSDQVVYRFNGFRLDSARRLLLSADGQLIPLKPKVFATLLYLVERPGELVDKEALIAAVWPHVVVEDNNNSSAVIGPFATRVARPSTPLSITTGDLVTSPS